MAPRSPAGLTRKLTNEPPWRAYVCDVGDPADDMGAQRSVIASPFAVAIDFVARRRQLCNREWRELRKIRI